LNSAPIICFHRHSRIVRRKTAIGGQLSGLSRHSGWRRPRSMVSAMSRRDRSGQAVQSDRTAPSAHRRRSRTTSAPAGDLLTSSFAFIDIPGSFVKKPLSSVSLQLSAAMQDGADPGVWGLRCPEGTGQAKHDNLTDLRLRRIADVQKQCLRQPATQHSITIVAYDFGFVKRQQVPLYSLGL